MKKLLVLALFLTALFAPTVHAQTRFLAGVEGGDDYDNINFGVNAAVEIPVKKHFELDIQDTFSPVESHVSLGHGWANLANVQSIVWFGKGIGLVNSLEYSNYSVTKVAKGADYYQGGLIFSRVVYYQPVRFGVNFVHQVWNGITVDGVETSHLNGADAYFDVRLSCAGAACFRLREDWTFGQVQTQGNPVCDGSFGPAITCPRTKALGGGFQASFRVEFPRHAGHEYEAF